jgi:hypothetical protein
MSEWRWQDLTDDEKVDFLCGVVYRLRARGFDYWRYPDPVRSIAEGDERALRTMEAGA